MNGPPRTTTPTKWIVAGLLLGGVAVVSLVVLVAALRDGGGGTAEVGPTTSSSSTTTSVTTTAAPNTPTEPEGIEVSEERLTVAGAERTYRVIAPDDVAAGERLPVVFALHGLGVDSATTARVADWRGAVAADRFVAVFPQGLANSWNMGPCCPPANLVGTDDRSFLDDLVALVQDRPDVDSDRMYMTGFSNGALMVYAYTCQRPGVFAAIAPMAGSNVSGCEPAEPISLLHQHGDADLVVPYNGGLGIGSLISSAPFPRVRDSVAAWAAADGCAAGATVDEQADVVRTVWADCADDTRVELVTVPGKGHDWPRRGSYEPLDELLRFFDIQS